MTVTDTIFNGFVQFIYDLQARLGSCSTLQPLKSSASCSILENVLRDAPVRIYMEKHIYSESAISELDLSVLPPIHVLPTHLEDEERWKLEEQLLEYRAPLTDAVPDAKIFLTKIERKKRAAFELRSHGIWTEEVPSTTSDQQYSESSIAGRKRKHAETKESKTMPDDSSTESESGPREDPPRKPVSVPESSTQNFLETDFEGLLKLVRLSWLGDCIKSRKILPLSSYIIYIAKPVSKEQVISKNSHGSAQTPIQLSEDGVSSGGSRIKASGVTSSILSRAQADMTDQGLGKSASKETKVGIAPFPAANSRGRPSPKAPSLLRQSTTEHDHDLARDLPEMPDWVKRGLRYSCQRSTPVNGPNDSFIGELKKIRLARKLTSDEIGVRAYSTSIAAIAAYPHTLTSPREVLALPGCEAKIAALFMEWKNSGERPMQAVLDTENDERMKTIRLFYEIWSVGPQTAREFYEKGWRDLDDVVEFGWKDLSRTQQIGVKFYDEFLLKIPRFEVESIREQVHKHMQRIREPTGVRTCIVGGYRRGKTESGDADIIVSHLDEEESLDVVNEIVDSLTKDGWVTNSLIVSTSGARRSQATRPFRPEGGGHGFDSLDKAMVVWQDPNYREAGDDGKNPNAHRRVDIIVAPWSKVGCAVLGWSAGTTFERDLRRYAKVVKGWKFDSSGIRDRNTGRIVDLENRGGRCQTVEEAERKVFEGLGLEYREPWERCTG